ncbi:hypothetical protein BKP35_12635 [Anaerobacillus arseniciselenatis]|uniref:DUF2953 domain-containing protein n=1 Tax=Anaerobacillus arseniciselenatis TaxID=85682 RepID=A0A1S2LEI7_9BACI|nr:DUF2953 domain-containing protein [Anaerobacillus arseniciselenatis]OIJ10929.1 hypothetical protein BKP35_12635 [Anaerobacillus arseniciselenatis]
MHWIWWVVISITSFLILLPFAKLKVNLTYFHDQDNDELNVKISTFFGLASYKVSVPVLKVDENSASIIVEEEQHSAVSDNEKTKKITPEIIIRDIRKIKDFLRHVIGFHKIVKRFLRKISIHHFSWKSRFGVGEAAATGTLVGSVWGIKGSTLGVVSHYMKLKAEPIIEVQPTFQQLTSHTEVSCMFSFRLGHAIVAALQILKHWKKRPKFVSENLYEQNGIQS